MELSESGPFSYLEIGNESDIGQMCLLSRQTDRILLLSTVSHMPEKNTAFL